MKSGRRSADGEGMKKRKGEKPPVVVSEKTWPGLAEGQTLRETQFSRGAVQFSTFVQDAPIHEWTEEERAKLDVRLKWQSYRELCDDHGQAATYGALFDAGFLIGGGRSPTALAAEIKADIGNVAWQRVEKHLSKLGNENDECAHKEIFLIACWAELFSEPYEELWLAAMAHHAYFVEENDFAFGYLTALLDQKRENETHFLRGKKIVESSRAGGLERGRQQTDRTRKIIDCMEHYVADGHSLTNAARLTFKAGQGSSVDANRKAWSRHYKK